MFEARAGVDEERPETEAGRHEAASDRDAVLFARGAIVRREEHAGDARQRGGGDGGDGEDLDVVRLRASEVVGGLLRSLPFAVELRGGSLDRQVGELDPLRDANADVGGARRFVPRYPMQPEERRDLRFARGAGGGSGVGPHLDGRRGRRRAIAAAPRDGRGAAGEGEGGEGEETCQRGAGERASGHAVVFFTCRICVIESREASAISAMRSSARMSLRQSSRLMFPRTIAYACTSAL